MTSDQIWEAELEELERRRELAKQMGGPEGVARQHEFGKLTVRERIDALLDPGSFVEIEALQGTGVYEGEELVDFTPSNRVNGTGKIHGRPVAVYGSDFTIRGGSSTNVGKETLVDTALQYKLPLIQLLDAAGANVEGASELGYTHLPSDLNIFDKPIKIMQQSPVVTAVMGSVAGGEAGWSMLAHFSVMVRGTSALFASGPPVVRRALGHEITKDELGGADVHTRESGCIDNAADSELDACEQIRTFLSYMPSHVWELPPVSESRPPPEGAADVLANIVPRYRQAPYDMKHLLRQLVDGGEFFEIQPDYGESLIVALARIEGFPVGLVANNPLKHAGALDADAAEKQGRFLDMCDYFRVPPVYLVDIPGFMIGPQAERRGTLRRGMRALWTWNAMTVPSFTLHVRKCYGMAGAATSNSARLNYRVAWPSGEFGSIPIEGGVDAAFRREIAAAEDPDQRRAELEAELATLRRVFRTAEAGGVEEIIDPRETRDYLTRFLELSYRSMETDLGPKARIGVRP